MRLVADRDRVNAGCAACSSGFCARRGVKLTDHLRDLCANDARYTAIFDRRHGVVDSSVGPQLSAASGVAETASPRPRPARRRASARRCSGCNAGKPKRPSLARRALTAAQALAHWAADGGATTSEPTRSRRLEACSSCPMLEGANCRLCGCDVALKAKLRHERCPAGKWLQETELTPLPRPPVRHLMFHIWPVAGNGWWQWHADQLRRRLELFNGKRLIAIATAAEGDPPLDSVETVQAAFDGAGVDWLITPNVPKRREAATARRLLERLPPSHGDVTFFGHAKGVRNGPIEGHTGTIKAWCELMWTACLDDPESVWRALDAFHTAGALRRFNRLSRRGWHYSGSFYWVRNDSHLLRKPMARKWFGVESWPGDHLEHHHGGCLMADGVGDLYHAAEMDRVQKQFEAWRAARDADLPD